MAQAADDLLQIQGDHHFVLNDQNGRRRLPVDVTYRLSNQCGDGVRLQIEDDRSLLVTEAFHDRQQQCLPIERRQLRQPLRRNPLRALGG